MTESEDHLQSRKDEVMALSSIYDEELRVNEDGLSGTLIIPQEFGGKVAVLSKERGGRVYFLPGVEFHFSSAEGYPETEPPEVTLKCVWLPRVKIEDVEREIASIWVTTRDFCLYAMIDEVIALSKNLFWMNYLEVDEILFDEILQFAESQERAIFEQAHHLCPVCLENKKGVDCYQLPRCEHVFCKATIVALNI
jgi:hypothetical protein